MLTRLRSVARRLFGRSGLDSDMADELQFHLEARTDELMRSGVSPAEAARRARLEFGSFEGYAERCRDEWGFRRLNERLADLRFAFRTFRRDRTFTLTVLGTLTLGIGITTSVFTVVKAVLIQPLPYREVERLVMLRNVNLEAGIDVAQARRGSGVFAGDFAAWRDSAGIVDSLAAVHVEPRSHLGGAVKLTLADADPNAEPALVAFVSADFFKTVGVWPAAGRVFDDPGDVVLQDRYWHSRFDADPGVVGERVWHGYGAGGGWSSQWTVAGVMPAGFEVVSRAIDFLQAFDIAEVARLNGAHRLEAVIGRLRPGMSLEQAQARADAFSAQLARENPGRNRG